jgi:hypothetical protein
VAGVSLGDGVVLVPRTEGGGASDSGGVGKEATDMGVADGAGDGLFRCIIIGGGGVVPRRSGAEPSCDWEESGARLDSLRPFESDDGLMKMEFERKVG